MLMVVKVANRFSDEALRKEGMVSQQSGYALIDRPLEVGNLWELEQFSVGIFWLVIAAALLLSLCEMPAWSSSPRFFWAGWVGVFVLYYALRSHWRRSPKRSYPLLRTGQKYSPFSRGLQGLPVAPLCDVCVISLLVAFSGGWESPLYLLYFGWAITLLVVPSWLARLLISALAPLLFGCAVILAARQPLSAEQVVITAEHLLLVVLVCLSMSALSVYLEWHEQRWALERQQWKLLRHSVFAQLSHELFTPLSAIKTSTALLSDVAEGVCLADEQKHRLFEVIQRNCARMSLLLDELLELWRCGQQLPCALQSVECVSLAREMVRTLQPLFAAKQQECLVVARPASVAAWAQPQRLEQVLVNLLSNAQKYSLMRARVLLEIEGADDEVRFAVRDAGPGIPFEEQRQLFTLGFRGSRTPAGTRGAGLGLFLAKMLIGAQGGRIWVESRPGQGSTFYFTLPRAPLEEESDAYSAG